ncbi:MAG: 2-oxoacid:acceptor oxidoreductase family protein [Dehalococcoidia bacterium]|nr:2-oxoacid:acceptor oxidoreductase family protein [Dehalococcoidia bacterium]
MGQERANRGEVIITGLGGAGVLTAGTLLAEAAVERYKNVTWFPSYAISKRGGFTECSVVFSDGEIASPLLSQAEGVIVAEAAQFEDFERRVRPGGTMVVEKAGLQAKKTKKDITVVEVPAIEMAISSSGTSQGANLILLGAFLEVTGILSLELIERQIEKAFAGKEKALESNLKAIGEGRNLIRNFRG